MLLVVVLSVVMYIPFALFISISSSGYIQWIVQAIIVTLYATIVTVLINYLLDKEELKIVLERIKRLVKR